MKKHELRDQAFLIEERTQRKRSINTVWMIVTLLMILGTYVALTAMMGYSPADIGVSPIAVEVDFAMIPVYFITLVISVYVYFFLKLAVTLPFCRDKSSAKLKFLQDRSLPIFPVCFCREAFRVWQTAVMNGIPIVIVYAYMFFFCVMFGSMDAGFMTMLFFMSFFMAFDLTLVLYAVMFKIRDKIDYISIDYHIYGVTLFKQAYIRSRRGANRFFHENNRYIDNGKFKWQRNR